MWRIGTETSLTRSSTERRKRSLNLYSSTERRKRSLNLFIYFLLLYFLFLIFISIVVDHQIFFLFTFISWRLITLQYCSGFCYTLTWISHGLTCIPHPDPPSHLPLIYNRQEKGERGAWIYKTIPICKWTVTRRGGVRFPTTGFISGSSFFILI